MFKLHIVKVYIVRVFLFKKLIGKYQLVKQK